MSNGKKKYNTLKKGGSGGSYPMGMGGGWGPRGCWCMIKYSWGSAILDCIYYN